MLHGRLMVQDVRFCICGINRRNPSRCQPGRWSCVVRFMTPFWRSGIASGNSATLGAVELAEDPEYPSRSHVSFPFKDRNLLFSKNTVALSREVLAGHRSLLQNAAAVFRTLRPTRVLQVERSVGKATPRAGFETTCLQ